MSGCLPGRQQALIVHWGAMRCKIAQIDAIGDRLTPVCAGHHQRQDHAPCRGRPSASLDPSGSTRHQNWAAIGRIGGLNALN